MRADIFCFDEQESEVLYVTQLLRRHVYPAAKITVHKLGRDDKWAYIGQSAYRYGRLMQAAIPPASSLRVYPQEMPSSGCMYIDVLYRTSSEYDYRAFSRFEGALLGLFFPAVALHDRMCMVSRRLGSELSGKALGKKAFRTLEKAGVLQVDFTDDAAVEAAVIEAGKQVRAEVTAELAAYASYEKDWNLDFSKVAGHLGIDQGYIVHCLQAGAVERVVGRQLECRLDRAAVPLNSWTKVNLTVRNKSGVAVKGAEVRVAGPVQIRPGRIYVDVEPGAATQIALSFRPLEAGDVPVELTFEMPDDRPFSSWLPTHHVWLECGAAGKATAPRPRAPKTKARGASA